MNNSNTSKPEHRLALPIKAQLLEGLHWDALSNKLWGVDIHGRLLWCWDLQGSAYQSWAMPQRVGWVIPERGSARLLLGMQEGFALADSANPTQLQWVQRPFDGNAALRLNDAKADSTGAVWAGSLNNDDESRSDGCLYRLACNGQVSVVDTGYTVANGPAIRADGKLMLHTDSGRRTIYAFDLDESSGTLGNKRIWKTFADREGYPDGMCFDADGCVWVAHWGAGCVSRFAQSGELLLRISISASHVTNLCFAGVRLDRLFVSTARIGLKPEQLELEPEAGSLFEITGHGCRGMASFRAGILLNT